MLVYLFSTAAITNYHKVAQSKATLFFYCSGNQKSKMGLTQLESRGCQGCIPLADSREELVLFYFWIHHFDLCFHCQISFSD